MKTTSYELIGVRSLRDIARIRQSLNDIFAAAGIGATNVERYGDFDQLNIKHRDDVTLDPELIQRTVARAGAFRVHELAPEYVRGYSAQG